MKKLIVIFSILCFVQFLNIAFAADGDPVLEGKAATGDITTTGNIEGATVTLGGAAVYSVGGTDVAIADGGTGAGTASAAFDALSPMTTVGDLIYGGASGTGTRLAAGATTEILVGGGAAAPVWTTATGTGAPVRANTPTLITPEIGAATGTSLTLSGGGNLVPNSGQGVDFTATGDASGTGVSMTSELFDDYEEGTWTPVCDLATGSAAVTIVRAATYVRIGPVVFIYANIVCQKGADTGVVTITGLPYAGKNVSNYVQYIATGFNDIGASDEYPQMQVFPNSTTLSLQMCPEGTGGCTDMTDTDLGANAYFYINGTYVIN